MLAGAAGAVAAMLWSFPAPMDEAQGILRSPDPLVVEAAPLRESPALPQVGVQEATSVAVPAASSPTKPPLRVGGAARPTRPAVMKVQAGDTKLDLNQASEEEFERLPGVGPGLAKHLVAYRLAHGPYRRVEDLQLVKGIGVKRYERLVPFVTVGSAAPAQSGQTSWIVSESTLS